MGLQDRDYYRDKADHLEGRPVKPKPKPKNEKPLPVFNFPSHSENQKRVVQLQRREPVHSSSPVKTAVITIIALALLAVALRYFLK